MPHVAAGSADTTALLKANRRGILFMCAAMGCFVVNDSLVKYASQSMPSAQLIFIRGMMASLLVLLLVPALMEPVAATREGFRAIAGGQPFLGQVAESQVIRSARPTHLRGHPPGIDGVAEDVRPEPRDGG